MDNKLLWYKEKAKTWTEALPLGNGNMGALVFGDYENERIALNISTLWSGDGRDKSNPNKDIDWKSIKDTIRNGDYQGAESLIKENVLGDWSECFLPAGDIYIDFDNTKGSVREYKRSLDISTAVYEEEYKGETASYKKEAFCDYDTKAVIIKYVGDGLSGKISLKSQLEFRAESANNVIALKGRAPSYAAPVYYECENPVRYDGPSMDFEIKLVAKGVDAEKKEVNLKPEGEVLSFDNLSELTVYAFGDTNFKDQDAESFIFKEKNISGEIDKKLSEVISKDYNEIKSNHIKIYQSYYNRMTLSLGEDTGTDTLKRVSDFNRGNSDTGLVNLIFNYGKYLLISSSCPDGEAANLQGIWNVDIRAPWSSNYTVNINTEMNYWPAEPLGLSENVTPLFNLMKRMEKRGKAAANQMYKTGGWVAHHNVDIWGQATPVGYYAPHPDSCTYGMWNLSGAWLCRHLYDHYAFTGDKDFLKETAFPLTDGAVEFFLSWLDDEDGTLLTMPSTSPENQFLYENGKRAATAMGSTMDMAIIRELFSNYIKICDALEIENENKTKCNEALGKLLGFMIGKHGQLQEWYKDFEENDINHRHVSHLYGLYPSDTIKEVDKDLREACKVSLERRGDEGTGWCIAWKAALWARLLNGKRAFDLLKKQMRLTDVKYVSAKGGGVYANLFCAHPPFQIDGNFGFTAAVCEMLIQSQEEYTRILPALPPEWEAGSVEGIRGRGGFSFDFSWKENIVSSLVIKAKTPGALKIIVNDKEIEVDFSKNLEVKVI